MASIWKGSLSFGLVNIPVQLHSAVRADDRISFRQLHEPDNSPIKYDRVCQHEGVAVPYSEIVKGYEYSKGKFVILTDEDFKAAALESSKSIEILDFVEVGEIDPRFFETPYYLVPQKGGEKAYALLREAVRRTGMVGIGKITMRSNSQHLAAVKVVGDALILEIMRFASELVEAEEFTFPSAESLRPQELQMAELLVQNLAEPFTPEKYVDDYKDALMKIIKAKIDGESIEISEPNEPEPTRVVDLMARLQESLAQGKSKKDRAAKTSASSSSSEPAPAAAAARAPAASSRKAAATRTRRRKTA